jgi:hypothetical protein
MITERQINLAKETWLKAAEVFDIEILIPYSLSINGMDKEIFAYISGYGSPNGTIICLMSGPNWEIDNEISSWAKDNNIFYSCLNVELFQNYDKKHFIELLKDWKKF